MRSGWVILVCRSREFLIVNNPQGVYTGAPVLERDPDALPRLLTPVKDFGASFSERVQTIVQQLQVHPDLDCRFFGIRLSFSDFYKSKKDAK
jgi:gamma-tubulin complex component 3